MFRQMDRIFLWLRYRIPGYRRRLSAQERCTLKIPTELIDMVLEPLPPESAIAFALTCRALFVKHFPKSAQLSAPARATLLQWLEQDNPELYFCHGCACLHSWRAAAMPGGGFKFYYGPCAWNHSGINRVMNEVVSAFQPGLTYSWARLVMNRHLYGARHGPPLRDIETTERGKKAQSLRNFIRQFERWLVCRHFRAATIPEISRDEESSRPFHPTTGNIIRSCPLCFTDYQIRVTLGNSPRRTTRKSRDREPMEGEDWSVEVARWHNLGKCRSPHDLEWCNLVTTFPSRTFVRREHESRTDERDDV
ncbi:hypothetical protein QBC34DRAFT_486512 [Podospora aff. communis PSN243]|uniref:F-box domain-containing protein n=1 Tax=Podospora aff. communis PSN243 TaxID=3040156 RepID=A0AAV9GFB7_9PEZI|nr:hypothetical protein QBC34DRAFT_486512 [Podospora aff. communis PSN243]